METCGLVNHSLSVAATCSYISMEIPIRLWSRRNHKSTLKFCIVTCEEQLDHLFSKIQQLPVSTGPGMRDVKFYKTAAAARFSEALICGEISALSLSSVGSSHHVRNLKIPFCKWSTEQVCDWLEEIGLGQYGVLAHHWVTGGQTLLSATPQDLERVIYTCTHVGILYDASVWLMD